MFERILVTGASGRLGSNLARRLVERGEKVRGFVLPDDPDVVADQVKDAHLPLGILAVISEQRQGASVVRPGAEKMVGVLVLPGAGRQSVHGFAHLGGLLRCARRREIDRGHFFSLFTAMTASLFNRVKSLIFLSGSAVTRRRAAP